MTPREEVQRRERSVTEWVRQFQAEEYTLVTEVQSIYNTLFPSFKEELHRYFLQNFVITIKGAQVWDAPTAVRLNTVSEWDEEFASMLTAAEVVATQSMDEAFEHAHDEGYALGLWMVAQEGFPLTSRVVPDDALAYLAAGAIGGLHWATRAAGHRMVAQTKFNNIIRGAIAQGAGYPTLAEPLNHLLTDVQQRIVALADNELYVSQVHGMTRAVEPYAHEMDMIWVARTNPDGALLPDVCEFCAGLHLTVTQLVPTIDSHPHCRCRLVPVTSRPYTPLDYAAFRTTLSKGLG